MKAKICPGGYAGADEPVGMPVAHPHYIKKSRKTQKLTSIVNFIPIRTIALLAVTGIFPDMTVDQLDKVEYRLRVLFNGF